MKEEEVRSRHRALLLQLREKTLKVSCRHTHRNSCYSRRIRIMSVYVVPSEQTMQIMLSIASVLCT